MALAFRQKITHVARLSHIATTLARYGFRREVEDSQLSHYVNGAPANRDIKLNAHEPNSQRARQLAQAFEELGPTFIKLGQILSVREDLLPSAYTREFKRLHDQVKPVPTIEIKEIIRTELSEELFNQITFFDEKPVGSASIGQVHKAIINSKTPVVFKIQKKGVKEIILGDLSLLMSLFQFLELVIPELKIIKPSSIVTELKKALIDELDYLKEASNAMRMKSLLEQNEDIVIPKTHLKFCTKKVLCMDEIQGKKLTSDINQEEKKKIISTCIKTFFDMTFEFGFFHGDLHPGNLILCHDGKLGIIDFGICVRLPTDIKNNMAFMLASLAKNDLERAARLFAELSENPDEKNNPQFEKEIFETLDNLLFFPSKEVYLGKLLIKISRSAATYNRPLPRDFILFFRALFALESFSKNIDNSFDMLKFANTYAKEKSIYTFDKDWLDKNINVIMQDSSLLIKDIPVALRFLVKKLSSGDLSLDIKSKDIFFLSKEIDRASNRLSLSLLLGFIVLASSIASYGKQGALFDVLSTFGLACFIVAILLGLWLILGIIRSGRFK